MSHDSKEPLSGIHKYAHQLLDEASSAHAERRRKLEALVRLTLRLDGLLGSLLHYSRVGRSALVYEDVDRTRRSPRWPRWSTTGGCRARVRLRRALRAAPLQLAARARVRPRRPRRERARRHPRRDRASPSRRRAAGQRRVHAPRHRRRAEPSLCLRPRRAPQRLGQRGADVAARVLARRPRRDGRAAARRAASPRRTRAPRRACQAPGGAARRRGGDVRVPPARERRHLPLPRRPRHGVSPRRGRCGAGGRRCGDRRYDPQGVRVGPGRARPPQARAEDRAPGPAGRARARPREQPPDGRCGRPRVRGARARRAGLGRRRPDAPGAGRERPAGQRCQVHATGWQHRAVGGR